ncbi:carbohydrate ABC transporter permease [Streptacidiphilus albus]|uniref:carbohydrate ABC transporter permease n=1 Tax=Streptacidiphilus albus TaxID=105425 RepID=UPI00054C3DF6|nr:sugar ABC transporter permease [Streptacidiphilus albus]
MATIETPHSPPRGGAPLRRPRTDPDRGGTLLRGLRRNGSAYLFLIGALLCFAVFSWYPMVREFILSFQKVNIAGQSTGWVGFDNYQRILKDPDFLAAWKATAIFAGFALVFGYAVPFVIAVVLNELRHAKAYFRLLVYLPVMMPPVAAAFLWKYFYTPDNSGLFNDLMHTLHLPTSAWTQSSSPTFAVLCLVLFSTWINMGGGVLIYLASLQGIPGELYEAAEIDGAGILKRVWHVTIPQTRLILSMMLLLQLVATMQVFLEPFILTGGSNSTVTVVYLVYEYAFSYGNFGGAAALGVILFVVLGIFSGAYMWLSGRGNED